MIGYLALQRNKLQRNHFSQASCQQESKYEVLLCRELTEQ